MSYYIGHHDPTLSATEPADFTPSLFNSVVAELTRPIVKSKVKQSKQYIAVSNNLCLTCHMGSHSVICQPPEAIIPPFPQPKQVLDLTATEGCKAELTYVT